MTEELLLHLGQSTMTTIALVAGPLLISALLIGLLISIFQAITQINEATLTFIPKMIVVALVILLAGPWMVDVLTQFATEIFSNFAEYVREQ